MISIHALREEGDKIDKDYTGKEYGFLSTPSVRRATLIQQRVGRVREFLSTPSVRRATIFKGNAFFRLCNFYPRPP